MVEAQKRRRTRSVQCSITEFPGGKKTILVFFVMNLMFIFLYFSSGKSPLYVSLAVCTNYSCFVIPLPMKSPPSLCSAYMQRNEKIFHTISYELKAYVNFVLNLEEE